MKSNTKLAPMSCHCKLSLLIPHLKSLSAKKVPTLQKGKNNLTGYSDTLYKGYL